MELLSRAWRTDLRLLELAGSEVDHHPTYVVVRTPANPTFYWGNFVLLRRAPLRQDLPSLLARFADVLPGIEHRAFGVDDPHGTAADLDGFADAGFEVDVAVTLTAAAVHPPPRPNTSAELRALATDDDWAQRVSLDLACHAEQASPAYEDFVRRRAAAERYLVEQGNATWFGAFDDGRLVSTLGLVRAGEGLARYQEVQTHPEARGRGLAGTLVHLAGAQALARPDVDTLVVVADPDYHAIGIYRSVGFDGTESQLQAFRKPAT